MRRLVAFLAASMLVVLTAGPAAAVKPDRSCSNAASGYVHVDRDMWWDATVGGFAEFGLAVYEADGVTFTDAFNDFAEAAGFGDGAGLEDFVRGAQWAVVDKNDNGWVCMKDAPNTPGLPGYIFGGIDDTSHARK